MTAPWDFNGEVTEMANKLMCENPGSESIHPGASSVIHRIIEIWPEENTLRILFTHMAAMRMWGILLYYAVDECGNNIPAFAKRVLSMDTSLVVAVNQKLDLGCFPANMRLVKDGYIDWPAELPDPKIVRMIAQ